MSEVQAAPKLPKWPFYLADVVVSGIAAYVLTRLGAFQETTQVVIAIGCLLAAAWAAWLSIMPWLTDDRTRATLAESTNLKSTLEQIQDLEKVGDLIRQSNSQWQSVQDASGRTVTAAREIADKMKLETDEFMKFIENAHDQERAGLRLEVDKLRKMEGDWIKVTVQILDHIFALFRAAERSGQEQLIQQLAQFQGACRDVARRMGLAPFFPSLGDNYDPRGHQLPNPPPPIIDEQATIAEVLAPGFTYQGQLLRRSLVLLSSREEPRPTPPSEQVEQVDTIRQPPEEVPMFAEPEAERPPRDRSPDHSADAISAQNELPLA